MLTQNILIGVLRSYKWLTLTKNGHYMLYEKLSRTKISFKFVALYHASICLYVWSSNVSIFTTLVCTMVTVHLEKYNRALNELSRHRSVQSQINRTTKTICIEMNHWHWAEDATRPKNFILLFLVFLKFAQDHYLFIDAFIRIFIATLWSSG